MSLANLSKFGINYLWRTPAICHNLASKHSYYTYSLEPSQPIPGRLPCVVDTAAQAVECIKSDQTVFIQGAPATPLELVEAMTAYGKKCKLKNITVCHMYTEGTAEYCHQDYKDNFRTVSFFVNKNVRGSVYDGRSDTIPIMLHEIPLLFYKKIYRPDVSLIQVTPPDKHGYCSLGPSVDCVRAALIHSKYIVAQFNKQVPRTFGDALIHQSHIDFAFCFDSPLPVYPLQDVPPTKAQIKLAKIIAEKLVDDGATLQLGIGSLQEAILSQLHNHKDLGIHSEMLPTGIVDLWEKGCITNAKKTLHKGSIVATMAYGLPKLYAFLDNNPYIEMLNVYYVNNTKVISLMPKMTAINSCIEIDLTGQVCSDSVGTIMFSGFGGHVDFTRGAAEGVDGLGKPIIALQSLTNREESKIVPYLKTGAGVATSRAHVHYVVTEYGIASLFGKTLRQRAYALIQIAHPDHREKLEKAAFDRLKCMPAD